MSAVTRLESEIYNLAVELASCTRISDVAAVQVIDSASLAVIPYAKRDFCRITEALQRYSHGDIAITSVGSALCLSLRTAREESFSVRRGDDRIGA
ncbi:hypothetical protein [Antrihabitans spumae]|jgi:ribosome recycling factor|uniref:Uncharacterized protein n=1 Tax=Antrihabitans spumae TaxID=3373370 RepID=A0ABW7KJZ4_9NOCA